MKKLPIPHKEIYVVPVRSFSEFTFGTSALFAWKNTRFITNLDGVRGVFHIHGTVDANTIYFDAAQVVEKYKGYYKNYDANSYTFIDFVMYADTSLRSALSAADVWFVNPLGEKPERQHWFLEDEFLAQYEAWKAAQNNVVEKVVIIEKVK